MSSEAKSERHGCIRSTVAHFFALPYFSTVALFFPTFWQWCIEGLQQALLARGFM
jgi:hypothetical protein